jgi:signal transduction histidine kinase/ActR/RegA family two-component response regulator
METGLMKKDGGKLPVLLSGSVMLDGKGLARGIACVAKNITESKQAEEALRQANEEIQLQIEYINKAQEQLIHAEKLASVGSLTADVSHEILNPLNVITMRLQIMMSDPATPPEVSRHLKILDEQANRIAKLSQDLLSFARRRPPERRNLDINAIAQRTLDLWEHKLRKENVSFEIELDSSLPPVLADEDQIQQVIFNFITNARDAMPEGGSMTLHTRAIEDQNKTWVEFRVEDSGAGIAPEHLDRLFDPFFTTKAEGEGTGLGLSICQNIVKAHGGSIWAEKSSTGGAAFVMRLGAEEAPLAKKILVVDDEPLMCELLQEFLVEKGYNAIIAQSGEEALEAYIQYRPDAVLLDVLMPGKGGLEVLRELKAIDPNVAILLVTAVREEEVIKQARAEGALDYINKPIDKDHLELALRTRVSMLNSVN